MFVATKVIQAFLLVATTTFPAVHAASPASCPHVCLNFEEFRNGDYVTNQLENAFGVVIQAIPKGKKGYAPGGAARIYDSSKPIADPDLGSPNQSCPGGGPGVGLGGAPNSTYPNCDRLGNVLIIQEKNKKTPDDSATGGDIVFRFARPVAIKSVAIIDVDDNNKTSVEVLDAANKVTFFEIPQTGDNGVYPLRVDRDNAIQLKVALGGSGAVDNLCYSMCEPTGQPTRLPTPGPTVKPTAEPTKLPTPGPTVKPTAEPTKLPTPEPTAEPTAEPTKLPTPKPTMAPSAEPTKLPTPKPTTAPTGMPTLEPTDRPTSAPTSCPYVCLDFEEFRPDDYVTNQLKDLFGVQIRAIPKGKKGYAPGGAARIFDTTNPIADPDLGSPNQSCPGGGPGVGLGGAPNSTYPNCDPLGNVLIIQETNKKTPDDSATGGHIVFDFVRPVDIESVSIIDIDDSMKTFVEVLDAENNVTFFEIPQTGDNGVYPLRVDRDNAMQLKLTLGGSGAVDNLCYYMCPY